VSSFSYHRGRAGLLTEELVCCVGVKAYVIGMGAANLLFILLFRKLGGMQLDLATLSAGRAQHYDSVGRRGRAGLRWVTWSLQSYGVLSPVRTPTTAPSALVT
jgi:hypothetical protein